MVFSLFIHMVKQALILFYSRTLIMTSTNAATALAGQSGQCSRSNESLNKEEKKILNKIKDREGRTC
jgi:hypothetical protein